jgi:hypothetical protein
MVVRLISLTFAVMLTTATFAQAQRIHPHHNVMEPVRATGAKVDTRKRHKKVRGQLSDRRTSERQGYKKVSALVNFPSFFPGIGALYVRPNTLPVGPFRAFDRQDRLVSTIYMIPVGDIEQKKTFDLAGLTGKGDHVTMYFNSGHPGVEMPHYHVVIWHVSKKDEARVAR